MSSAGAAPRAAVQISNARAEASRKNGARSRGPKTLEGKARSAQNALKHGLRAQKYVVLPEEDADEFAELEAAMIEELAPVGALQIVLARRVAVAAWRLARADRLEVELFEQRGYGGAGPAVALIRDGNGTRSFETLLRYRGAAMAEFWRALKTLKALQAEARADAAAEVEAPVRPGAVANGFGGWTARPIRPGQESAKRTQEPRNFGQRGQRRERVSSGDTLSSSDPGRILLPPLPVAAAGTAAPRAQPIEPEIGRSGGFAPAMANAPRA